MSTDNRASERPLYLRDCFPNYADTKHLVFTIQTLMPGANAVYTYTCHMLFIGEVKVVHFLLKRV